MLFPGRIDNLAVGADQQRALPLRVVGRDDPFDAGDPRSTRSARADQDLVSGEQPVGLTDDLNLPGVQHQEVVAHPLEVGDQMRRQDHRQGRPGDGVDQRGEELPAGEGIEAGQWFVEQQQPWTLGQRQAQRHLGALTARQLVDAPVERHTHLLEAFPTELHVEVGVEPVAHPEQLVGGEVPIQRSILGNEPDTWQGPVSRCPAEHADRALRRANQPGGTVQQRGLAGPVRADEGNDRPLGNGEAAMVQCERPPVTLRETLSNQRVAHADSSRSSTLRSVVSTTALMCSRSSPAARAWAIHVSRLVRSSVEGPR